MCTGQVVIFTADGGYDYEIEQARKVLTVGKSYTIDRTDVHSFNTDVWLVGVKGRFNSALFSPSQS